METTDCIVVGAGVVGLAVARTLAAAGREVMVLEAEARIGEHTSSRNSEVIHAGLYYKKGSLRQHLLPRASHLMYAYCAEHGVPHKRLGKLVVARHKDEVERLRHHMQHAIDAGVEGIKWLDADEARELEPNLVCYAAFLSPNSGIVDSHSLMLAYQAELESHGGRVVLRAPVTGGEIMSGGIRVDVGGAEPTTLMCKLLINCAGHGAVPLGARARGPTGRFCAAQLLPPRRLFQRNQSPVQTADLSRARSRRHGYPRGRRHRRQCAVRTRTSSGWMGSTTRSILAEPTHSIARSARSTPGSPTARSRLPMPASGRASAGRTSRPSTS